MVAPIFKFRNVKVRLDTTNPIFIYGVVAYDSLQADKTLGSGVSPDEVTSVVLTVQVSNITSSGVIVSAYVQNSTVTNTFANARALVENYPLVAQNAFDPLSGNLALTSNDQLWIQTSSADSCDVIVSLLEIANATAT